MNCPGAGEQQPQDCPRLVADHRGLGREQQRAPNRFSILLEKYEER